MTELLDPTPELADDTPTDRRPSVAFLVGEGGMDRKGGLKGRGRTRGSECKCRPSDHKD